MIDIKNITKSFGSLQVLKGIDLRIEKGEVVSIVGPSGAGKTTLLQILGTLDKPDSGSVVVDGIDVGSLSAGKLSDFRNQHLGFVFQFHQLLPEFTALENIMIPAYIAGKKTKDARKRAEELLEFMGLSDGDTTYANSNRRPFYRPVENSRSIFSITPNELKVILQSRNTISSPVTAIPGGQFVRVVDTGKNIGITSLKEGGIPTRYIKIFTDEMGNLITTYPVKGQ